MAITNLDPVTNFGKANLLAGIIAGANTLTVSGGDALKFPDADTVGAFNASIYNATDYANPSDDPSREIVRVTNITGGTFTIVRAQEGTSDVNHNTAGKVYVISLGITKKTIDDINANVADLETQIQDIILSSGAFGSASGIVQRTLSAANGVQTIPHGLGVIPSRVNLTGIFGVSTNVLLYSQGYFDDSGQRCIFAYLPNGGPLPLLTSNDTSNAINLAVAQSGAYYQQTGVVTVDDTNIYITWTRASTGGFDATANIVWEAFAGSSGGASLKKVGVGENTEKGWYNVAIPLHILSDSDDAFSISNGSFSVDGGAYATGNNFRIFAQSNASWDYLITSPNGSGGVPVQFSNPAQFIFSQFVRTQSGSANTHRSGVGIESYGLGTWPTSQGSSSILGIGFVRKDTDGTWYARVCDGSAYTEVGVTIADDAGHILRVEYDPANATPQARFYVDGELVATITTNLPTAATDVVGFASGCNSTGGDSSSIVGMGVPSFAVEIL